MLRQWHYQFDRLVHIYKYIKQFGTLQLFDDFQSMLLQDLHYFNHQLIEVDTKVNNSVNTSLKHCIVLFCYSVILRYALVMQKHKNKI